MERRIEPGLRALPSVDAVLKTNTAVMLVERFGRNATVGAIRTALQDARTELKTGVLSAPTTARLAQQALGKLRDEDQSSLRMLFNLTGTVLHTNLGRAVLAEEAITAATEAMRNAVALEFDLVSGKRGERDDHVRSLLCELTGAEDATVVNNNAAAVLLAVGGFLALENDTTLSSRVLTGAWSFTAATLWVSMFRMFFNAAVDSPTPGWLGALMLLSLLGAAVGAMASLPSKHAASKPRRRGKSGD